MLAVFRADVADLKQEVRSLRADVQSAVITSVQLDLILAEQTRSKERIRNLELELARREALENTPRRP